MDAKYCTQLACIQVNGIGIFAWTHWFHNTDTYFYSDSVYRSAHRQIQPTPDNGSGSGILHASGIRDGLSGAFQFNRCMAHYCSQSCIWCNQCIRCSCKAVSCDRSHRQARGPWKCDCAQFCTFQRSTAHWPGHRRTDNCRSRGGNLFFIKCTEFLSCYYCIDADKNSA